MKRLPAFALLVASLTLPIYAQRSASRGGFSGHSAPSFRGGFGASTPQSFAGAPGYIGSRPLSMVPGLRRNGPANYLARPAYSAVSPYRRRYFQPYHARLHFVAPVWTGWIGPGFLGYPDITGYGDLAAPPNYAEPYESQPPDVSQPAPSNLYPESVEPSRPSSALESEDAVTLVFKDGRPPEQIHNYVLSRTTLYVRDHHHRDIPLDQIDLAATQRLNHDAGVDFQLPEAPK
jgi:hypothetical protein